MYSLGGLFFLFHFGPLHLDFRIAGIESCPKLKSPVQSSENKFYGTVFLVALENGREVYVYGGLIGAFVFQKLDMSYRDSLRAEGKQSL